ncbi:MAG: hypothetical protein A3H28_00460 [Acidobacteria bacterium RIFCSPLOWO2_02_FULL_61_28]|nr:MAG: hypothetical protein A3H28_00460 [Acidobacteria bacterium RIFCSPLOWO2_02_FULL_61_28]
MFADVFLALAFTLALFMKRQAVSCRTRIRLAPEGRKILAPAQAVGQRQQSEQAPAGATESFDDCVRRSYSIATVKPL